MKNITNFINESYTKYNVDDLADLDGEWMGSYGEMYIGKNRCTLEEWAEAGLAWAEDAYGNEELSDEEYEDAKDHYEDFENWADARL